MYASYFGLKELPFHECMARDDLFPSRAMRDVHDSIVRALADTSKIVVLTLPIGCPLVIGVRPDSNRGLRRSTTRPAEHR